jgi:thiamine-monophosphate kinase
MTGERQLIKKIKDWTAGPVGAGATGAGAGNMIGDDCAVLPGQRLVSSDMLVEDRHFSLAYTDFESLGWKSCAVNLSDIAAMAGRPRYLTLCLSLPSYISEGDLQSFYQGFNQCAREHGAEVVGGDLSGGDKFVIAVTVIGEAHEKGLLKRSGAQVGDIVLATGNFGASALGLKLLQAGQNDQATIKMDRGKLALTAHRRPLPRLCEAFALVRQIGSRGALMDASDGLADALFQISEASAVSMKVNVEQIPIDPDMRALALALDLDPVRLALYGGEDYELVACADSGSIDFLEAHFPFVPIGRVVAQDEPGKPTVELVSFEGADSGNQAFVDLSNCYQHFW